MRRSTRQQQHATTTPSKSFTHLFTSPQAHFHAISSTKQVQVEQDSQLFQGKHGQVVFAKRKPSEIFQSPHCAVKSQYIVQKKSVRDKSYRELVILQQTSELCKLRKCPGFVIIYDWFNSKGDYFNEQDPSPVMNYVLERADETLFAFIKRHENKLEARQFCSIVFQLLFSLHVAQTELKFVHFDTHLKNVLIKNLPTHVQGCCITRKGKMWHTLVPFVAKLTDFGLSRITLQDADLQNKPQDGFDALHDVQKLAQELSKVQVLCDDKFAQSLVRDLKQKMHTSFPEDLLDHDAFTVLLDRQQCQYEVDGHLVEDSTRQLWYYGDVLPKKKILQPPKTPQKTPQKLALKTPDSKQSTVHIQPIVDIKDKENAKPNQTSQTVVRPRRKRKSSEMSTTVEAPPAKRHKQIIIDDKY